MKQCLFSVFLKKKKKKSFHLYAYVSSHSLVYKKVLKVAVIQNSVPGFESSYRRVYTAASKLDRPGSETQITIHPQSGAIRDLLVHGLKHKVQLGF